MHAKVPHWAIVPHIESCKAWGGRPTSGEEAKDEKNQLHNFYDTLNSI
jgi:hypothetical protein